MATIGTTSVDLATEVRDVLNAAGGSVGNDLVSFFQTSAKINIWAKFKPVIAPVNFYTLEEWQSYGYKGEYSLDGTYSCGFLIPTFASADVFYNAITGGTAAWTYMRPTGTAAQPYRLGDFRGYATDASHPVGGVTATGLMDANGYVTFSVDSVISDDYSLGLQDFDIADVPFTDCYLGVFAWNGSTYKYKTNTVTVGNNGANFTVSLQLNGAGTWNYIPFLCTVAQTGTEQAGKYFLLGTSGSFGSKVVNVVESSSQTNHTATATWNLSKTQISLTEIVFTNKTNSSVTFSSIVVSFRKGELDGTDVSIGTYKYADSVTVPANTDAYILEVEYTFSATYEEGEPYWVGVASNKTGNGIDVYSGIDEVVPE